MNELIDRRAAIDALGEEPEVWVENNEYEQGLNNQWHCDVNALKVLPIVDAVPVRHGKWVKISPANTYECSKCGKNVMTNDISEYNFCHGFGADMRGVEQSEQV